MNGQPKKIAALYLGLVFVAGSVLGVAAHRFYAVQTADARVSQPEKKSSKERRAEIVSCLRDQINLTQEQATAVSAIYDDVGEQYHVLREKIDPEVKELRAQRAERIMALLDDEQKTKYQELLAERERKRAEKGCN